MRVLLPAHCFSALRDAVGSCFVCRVEPEVALFAASLSCATRWAVILVGSLRVGVIPATLEVCPRGLTLDAASFIRYGVHALRTACGHSGARDGTCLGLLDVVRFLRRWSRHSP
jgi:hypothetical protein